MCMQQPDFHLPVLDLIRRPGSHRRVSISGPVIVELDQIADCGLAKADLLLEEVVGSVLARGEVTASMRLRCNRCLRSVSFDTKAEVVQAFGEDTGEDILPIDADGMIDLSGVLHDELSLATPLAPLCSETCRGLCPTCGNDLNIDPCEGHFEGKGSPFAALEGWLETRDRPAEDRLGSDVS